MSHRVGFAFWRLGALSSQLFGGHDSSRKPLSSTSACQSTFGTASVDLGDFGRLGSDFGKISVCPANPGTISTSVANPTIFPANSATSDASRGLEGLGLAKAGLASAFEDQAGNLEGLWERWKGSREVGVGPRRAPRQCDRRRCGGPATDCSCASHTARSIRIVSVRMPFKSIRSAFSVAVHDVLCLRRDGRGCLV